MFQIFKPQKLIIKTISIEGKREWQLLWPFYLSKFLQAIFLLTIPYWVIYFSNLGLSFSQISILASAHLLGIIIFEIPTGALADVLGRKFSVLVGIFLSSFALLIIPMTNSFIGLLILYFIWGIASTFISGADEAWVIDYLKFKNQAWLVDNFYAKSYALINLGMLLAPLIAGFLMIYFPIRSLWIVEGIAVFISGFILLFFTKEYFSKGAPYQITKQTINQLIKTIKVPFSQKFILGLLLITLFYGLVFAISNLAWQPFLLERKLPLPWLGYLYSLGAVLIIAYPIYKKRLFSKLDSKINILIFIALIQFILYLSIIFNNSILLISLIFVVIYNLAGLQQPIYYPLFQQYVSSEIRASLTSLRSLVGSFGEIIALLLGGYLMDIFGAKNILIFISIIFLPIIIIYFRMKRRE